MKRCPLVLFMAFLALAPSVSPQENAAARKSREPLPLDSPVYDAMEALYLAAGKGSPSSSRPWSADEANFILSRISRDWLTPREAALYDFISRALGEKPKFEFRDGFSFNAGLEASLEAYLHGNTAYNQESDWIRGHEERKPMARLSLDFTLKDMFYLYCDMQYGRNRFNIDDDLFYVTTVYTDGIGAVIDGTDNAALMAADSSIYSAPFLTNILEDGRDFDYQWPKRAVAAVGGPRWNFSLARDKLEWGNGHSGNFVIGGQADYQEYARLVAFSDAFRYEWLNVFLDANPRVGEQPDTAFKLFMAHRLEFRILEGLTFTISENVMYQNTVFDFKYLNPAFIFHNLNNRSIFNAIAHAEIDYSPLRGLKLYGQYAMDQGRAPTESAAQSDATGFLAGIEYAGFLGGGVLTSSLEGALTTPLLYRRDRVDFITMRKYYTNGNPWGPGYVIDLGYLGYEYGGDALVLQWDGAFTLPGRLSLAARLFGMRHGEMNFFMSHNKDGDNDGYADYEGTTPSGDTITDTLSAGLTLDYSIPQPVPWMELGLWVELDWICRSTLTKSMALRSAWEPDIQLTAGFSLSF